MGGDRRQGGEPRIYLYKLVADTGAAPCVQGGLLTLAICKPMIRRTAQVGDLIVGFAGKKLYPDNRLIYVTRVDEKLSGRDYYGDERYVGRVDHIYRLQGDHYVRRGDAGFHGRPQDLAHDLGAHPDYPRARVLLSRNFRYFGAQATAEYKDRFPLVKDAVERMSRGHRVRHEEALRQQLLEVRDWLWERPAPADTSPGDDRGCGTGRGTCSPGGSRSGGSCGGSG